MTENRYKIEFFEAQNKVEMKRFRPQINIQKYDTWPELIKK